MGKTGWSKVSSLLFGWQQVLVGNPKLADK